MKNNKRFDFAKIFLDGKRPYFWMIFLSFIVYARTLFFGFTYFDDNVLILDNLFFLRNLSNIPKAFTLEVFHIIHSSAFYYRPILTISYMIDAFFSGENPFFYHLSSLLIHLAMCVSIFVFLSKLKIKKEVAFLFSLIFAVHPVLNQAVIWLPGRNDSLLALFVTVSFICLIEFLTTKKNLYFWLHFLFFALSLFTKESSILFPILILFYGFFIFENKKVFVKILPVLFFGWGIIAFVWFYLRSIALSNNLFAYSVLGSIKSIFGNLSAVILYLGKIILPFNLSVLPTLQDSSLIYGFISLGLILVSFIFSKNKNYRLVIFGILWFLIFLLPSFINPYAYLPYFLEHRVYLPLIGLFLLFSEFSFFKNFNLQKTFNQFLLLFFIVFLSFLTILNSSKFANRISFWESAVKTSPSHPLAHKNLGAMYYLDGRFDEAKKEFLKAIEINFEEPMIHNNLGLIYMREGDYKKAQEEFELELKINPNYDNALFNLGLLFWNQNQKEKASEMWLKTIAVNPDYKDALKGLAIYYSEIKDKEKADYYFYQAQLRGVKF
jgi:tetratricopeptide (TPR) repeat protein